MVLKEKNIPKKIVYFDENSAIDYLQIVNHGNVSKSVETISNLNGNAGGEGEAGAKKDSNSITKKTIGLQGWMKASVSAGAKIGGSRLSKTTFSNSVLFDFLDKSTKGRRQVDILKNYKLSIYPDTMAYYASLGPLTKMIEGSTSVDEDVSIAISKMDAGIKEAKGYYELIGESIKDNQKIIVRFNIKAFRNNYRIQDLEKMNLNLYCIKVGQETIESLSFNSEFNIEDGDNTKQQGYADDILNPQTRDSRDFELLDVYDTFLAGVM